MLKPNTKLSKEITKKWSDFMAKEKNHQFSGVFLLLLTVSFYHVPVMAELHLNLKSRLKYMPGIN